MSAVYFTTKIATDESFCNRLEEKAVLARNIQKNQHTVVVAPRRYGKTSLVMNVLEHEKVPFSRVDLFCVIYEEEICKKVAAAISVLIKSIVGFSAKALQIIEHYFKNAYISIKAGHIELKLEFSATQNNPITQLENLLLGLEKLATKHKKPVVLFFDEFQDVLKVDQTSQIQAAIRLVAQQSKYVTYIFSGSSRHMLNRIFDDRNQPLYMLCHKMNLPRISAKDFSLHIQKAAHKKWHSVLAEDLMDKILSLTELHPFYVNMLCDKLLDHKEMPVAADIDSCWQHCLFENKGKIISDLESLNTNRIKVVMTIALWGEVNEPNSKKFLDAIKLPLSSVQNAIQYLLNYDYIVENDGALKCVDPLMKKFIVQRAL